MTIQLTPAEGADSLSVSQATTGSAVRQRRRGRGVLILTGLFLTATCIVMVFPFLWAAISSTKPTDVAFANPPVFLVGDAAHRVPPAGATGISSAMADAHNLAWKLALVLSGAAGPALLETYNAERHPSGRQAVEQAYNRYVTRSDPDLGTDGMQPAIPDLHVEFNRYRSTAVVPEPDLVDELLHVDRERDVGDGAGRGDREGHVATGVVDREGRGVGGGDRGRRGDGRHGEHEAGAQQHGERGEGTAHGPEPRSR